MKSIELFAGIGGIALAAEWAGIETVAFCEREPYCQKLLNQNFPNVPVFDDVRTLNRQLLEDEGVIEPNGTIDIISGGFPCQPYSIAGKRRGTEDDRDLWPEMFRIIKELRPTWVVGENVANFANMELDRTLLNLESAGYKVQTFLIPAVAVEARHERMRTFVVAYSNSFGRDNRGDNWEERFISCDIGWQLEKGDKKRNGRIDRTREVCSVLSDTDSKRLERNKRSELAVSEFTRCNHRRKNKNDGVQRWAAEPSVGRVAHGVPNRVDRIKGLGNAVVPQQIYPIFKAIVNISNRA
ncbi:DNA (cytosine-5-)-methyltransferase [Bacillus altitudinis]|uniref:DNA cytosine methyltransferase n=1 Tax=Bacillus altitudinis TaxID=293387 RepID=UPI0013EE6793|nr:DNA (cytosine-5-)-methyltransferase [Bacillus altitudinis]QII25647.1 DNA (cytosine-5-)-methyltransferase [Bacillus altitudinis]